MNRSQKSLSPTMLIVAGATIIVLSSPLFYLTVASLIIDIQNFLGASIDRQSVSFSSNDPYIQAMNLVGAIGLILVGVGLWKKRNHK